MSHGCRHRRTLDAHVTVRGANDGSHATFSANKFGR